jgi:hypothetical protein
LDKYSTHNEAEWWREILLGIDGANNFAFVISSNSIASKTCTKELAHAVRNSKRLIPILRSSNSREALRNGYDAFISHSHADRAWTRGMAERISRVEFHGRPLRPWLDEQFLDPGDLGQKAELTIEDDRMRAVSQR